MASRRKRADGGDGEIVPSQRESIGRKLRFEVFKRDSFTCQYCGSKAPDIVLECDHIVPVADGGETTIFNLITACWPCNAGKGAIPLSEQTVLGKQRRQLEELSERRIQIQMMLDWRSGLLSVEKLMADKIQEIINSKSEKWDTNERAREDIEKWVKQFDFEEILSAVDIAYSMYYEDTGPSWSRAFTKIPGIIRVSRSSVGKPYLRQLLYIRGILRNRLSHFNETHALSLLEEAAERGLDLDHFEKLAKGLNTWSQFVTIITDFVAQQETASADQVTGGGQ